MSHVARIDLVITDLDALKKAAEELGGVFHHGRTTYQWFGKHVGDYPLPAGIRKEDLGNCEHVISAPGVGYEIGVKQMPDGTFTLLFDFYGEGVGLQKRFCKELPRKADAWDRPVPAVYGIGLEKLKAQYCAFAATNVLRRQGKLVTRRMVGDKIQLTAE
jgi:hypothetical protein